MRPLISVIRIVIVSPEFIAVCIIFALFPVIRDFYDGVERVLSDRNPLTLLIPFGSLITFTVLLTRRLLFPVKHSTALIKWPLYPEFRLCVLCGLVLVFAGASLGALGAFLSGKNVLNLGLPAAFYVAGLMCSAIATFTMFMAQIRARSVLSGGK